LPIKWLWRNRIPRAGLTIYEGEPEVSKSTLMMWLAAQISSGKEWPDGAPNKPLPVLYISAEDPKSQIMAPRIRAHNLDTKLCRVMGRRFETLQNDGKIVRVEFRIDKHLEFLRVFVKRENIKVVILDPLSAFIGGKLNMNDDHEVREVLGKIADLAEELDIAFIVLRHFTKDSKNTNAKSRGGGSVAILAAARAAYAVANHPDDDPDDDSCRRVIARSKDNWGKRGSTKPLGFRLIEAQVKTAAPYEQDGVKLDYVTVPVVEFTSDEMDLTADELLGGKSKGKELKRARRLLKDWLIAGPQPSKAMYERAKEEDIARETLKRAKKDLKIVTTGDTTKMMWSLPEETLGEGQIGTKGAQGIGVPPSGVHQERMV
jgi:hypothetical protein